MDPGSGINLGYLRNPPPPPPHLNFAEFGALQTCTCTVRVKHIRNNHLSFLHFRNTYQAATLPVMPFGTQSYSKFQHFTFLAKN